MKLDKKEYEKMIADVEREFSEFLAKSESEAKPAESEDKAEDKKDEKSEDKKDEESKEAPKAEDKKEEEKPSEEKHDDEDKHDYDEKDVDELHKMYESMGKGELKLHKDATDKHWAAKCEGADVMKSEVSKEIPLHKSEELVKAEQVLNATKSELEAAKQANQVLEKSLKDLATVMNDFLTKKGPVRKSITSLEVIKKSEESEKVLSKSEVEAILKQKSMDPTTGAKDREAINNYYCNGRNPEAVKHLLNK